MAATVSDQPLVLPTTDQSPLSPQVQDDIPPVSEEISPEENQAMSAIHKYEYDVKMTCSGCSGAVTRVLAKAQKDGLVSEFVVNLDSQLVQVSGPIAYDDLTERIRKTGKEIRSSKEISV